jgi:glucose/arabinose dehydrogenase
MSERRLLTMVLIVLVSAWAQDVEAVTTNLPVIADTFINSALTGNNAGAEGHVAAGSDASSQPRRGLFRFDLSAIPPGSTVSSAMIKISVTGTPPAGGLDSTFDIHRLTEEWAEGNKNGSGGPGGENGAPASTGECTWLSKHHAVAEWRDPGALGDFVAAASASTAVAGIGSYSWTGTSVVADVQYWVNNPSRNYGCLLKTQSEGGAKTARQFGSRESASGASLEVVFDPPLLTPPTIVSLTVSNALAMSWLSATNRKYDVRFTDDLLLAPDGLLAAANIHASTNATTTWTDPPYAASPYNASNSPLFYRLSMLPDVATPLPIVAELVVSNLVSPTVLTHAGDGSGRLFVADQLGTIHVIDASGSLLPTPFLDITGLMTNLEPAFGGAPRGLNPGYDERGLLGLTFHPGYSTNGRFFVYYSSPKFVTDEVNHESIVAEYSVTATNINVADAGSRQVWFRVDQPEFNHNGGALAFGPDGYLYIALGDGGGGGDVHPPVGNGQENTNLLGAILRIDVDSGMPYVSPTNNPFVGVMGRDEIFAYGLRNPWKFSFDSGGSNELFVADVGQGKWEEVNIIEKGGNYGWRILEGNRAFDVALLDTLGLSVTDLKPPIHDYPHGPLGISIIGGYVYRGTAYSALQGKYVFGDFSTSFGTADGAIYYLEESRPGIWERFEFSLPPPGRLNRYVKGFGEGEDGEIYLLSTGNLGPNGTSGDVRRLRKP